MVQREWEDLVETYNLEVIPQLLRHQMECSQPGCLFNAGHLYADRELLLRALEKPDREEGINLLWSMVWCRTHAEIQFGDRK